MRYIDEHVGESHDDGLRWGVESICAALTELGAKIAPATYYEHRSRGPSKREVRDEELRPEIAEAPCRELRRFRGEEGVAEAEPRAPG